MADEFEKEVAKWWNEVKSSAAWSGAVIEIDWDDLWPEAKTDIRKVYQAALVRFLSPQY